MTYQSNISSTILLVDDEENALFSVSVTLTAAGFSDIVQCEDSRKVMDLLAKQPFHLIILDLNMPYITGMELLPEITNEYPEILVIVMTAADDLDTAVNCMKLGAYDFLTKPASSARLTTTVRRALEYHETKGEIESLKDHLLSDKLNNPDAFTEIITQSKLMYSIFNYIEAIGETSLPVLVEGETGVGKELIARVIHKVSGRLGEFVPVNVAGLDSELFSDTLFGHKKGAFTGAASDRQGMIANASGGTLFLDEIGDLSLDSQIKLLRLLQEKEYYPLGSDMAYQSDARFIFATNRNIRILMEEGRFRKDLYYRFKSHLLHIPPLRERKNDIPLLIDHFLDETSREIGKEQPKVSRELIPMLSLYHFPGNIRELQGMIRDSVVRHQTGLLSADLFRELEGEQVLYEIPDIENLFQDIEPFPTLKEVKKVLVDEALKRAKSSQTLASRMLGITRQTLNAYLKKANE